MLQIRHSEIGNIANFVIENSMNCDFQDQNFQDL